MSERSPAHQVPHPYPVVFDALVASLPTAGFDIELASPQAGRITLTTRWERVTIHVGAVDATTTTWIADSSQKWGLGRKHHARIFRQIEAALGLYLATYYPV